MKHIMNIQGKTIHDQELILLIFNKILLSISFGIRQSE